MSSGSSSNFTLKAHTLSIYQMYQYLWRSSYEIIVQQVVLDSIQDALINAGFGSFIRIGLSEKEANNIVHNCVGCSVAHAVPLTPTQEFIKNSYPVEAFDQDSLGSQLEGIIFCGISTPEVQKISKKHKVLKKLHKSIASFPEMDGVSKKETNRNLMDEFSQETKKDGGLSLIDKDEGGATKGLWYSYTETVVDAILFKSKAVAIDIIVHAAVKSAATLVFPPIYYVNKQYEAELTKSSIYQWTKYIIKHSVELAGINPLEGILAVNNALSATTGVDNTVDSVSFLVNSDYIQSRAEDERLDEFMKAYYLWMESVDGVMHTRDNIRIIWENKAAPYMQCKAAAYFVIILGLKFSTEFGQEKIDNGVKEFRDKDLVLGEFYPCGCLIEYSIEASGDVCGADNMKFC